MAKKRKAAAKKKKAATKTHKPTHKTQPNNTNNNKQTKPTAEHNKHKHAKVDTPGDVRAGAASRRPGFSKRQLSASLDEAGIAYLHFQKLGTPAEGRQAARAGDRDTLAKVYETHIKKPEPQAELAELAGLVKSGKRIALLCYCRDPRTCHRWRIVGHLEKRLPLKVDDLIPPLF